MPNKSRLLLVAAAAALLAAAVLPRLLVVPDMLRGMLTGLGVGLLLAALIASRLPAACDTGTPALRRRYLREFLPPMLAYAAATLLSAWLLKRVDDVALRAAVALLPVPPMVLALRAIMRYIRDTDELQRRIELEAVSIATASLSLLYLSAGFLQLAGVIDVAAGMAMLWVFPLMCLLYGVAKVAVSRRYG